MNDNEPDIFRRLRAEAEYRAARRDGIRRGLAIGVSIVTAVLIFVWFL